MIIQVELQRPHDEDCPLQLILPDLSRQTGTDFDLSEWVWKHGKDQLLSKLQFSLLEQQQPVVPPPPPPSPLPDTPLMRNGVHNKSIWDGSLHSTTTKEESKTEKYVEVEEKEKDERKHMSDLSIYLDYGDDSSGLEQQRRAECIEEHPQRDPPDEDTLQLKHRLDLADRLQKVQQEFLDLVQKIEEPSPKATADKEFLAPLPSASGAVDKAFNSMLDSLVTWSGCDYGLIAKVVEEDKQLVPKDPSASDLQLKLTKCASLNVPTFSFEQSTSDMDDDSSSSSSDNDDDSAYSQETELQPPRRAPQPITTYGPVYYKSISGSVTLMMDQLRFEPVNPTDLVHDLDSDDEDEDDACNNEYNYIEIYWDKVAKYQMTPKTSSKHLLKLTAKITTQAPPSRIQHHKVVEKTREFILKMSSRAELNRIAHDVKARVSLPYKHPKKGTKAKSKRSKNKQSPKRNSKDTAPSCFSSNNKRGSLNSGQLSPQERSVMLPPSQPKRIISQRNLLQNSNHSTIRGNVLGIEGDDKAATPPFHPVRRMTLDSTDLDSSFVSDSDSESESDSDCDEVSSAVKENLNLWSVDDILEKIVSTKGPIVLGAGKRNNQQKLQWENRVRSGAIANENTKNPQNNKRQFLLLPEQWQTLLAVPCYSNNKLTGVLVLASTDKETDDESHPETVDFSKNESVEGWVPLVVTLYRVIWHQKSRLDQVLEKTQALKEMEEKLKDSMRRHSEMIHGILPPMAMSKLKVQPQQFRSPLQYSIPTVTQCNTSDINSIHDSSISGSVGSRFGLVVGENTALPSMDSECTLNLYGANPADSDYQLYSLLEHDDTADKTENRDESKAPPPRSNSGNMKAAKLKSMAPGRSNSVSNKNAMLRLHRQSSMTNTASGRPIFSRMDSDKRGMLMMPGPNLVRMDSGRFGRPGIPRLNSLKSLHGALSMNSSTGGTSIGGSSIDTMDQSWRTMYTNDESLSSINPEDLPKTRANSVSSRDGSSNNPSTDMSQLTGETNIRYINSGSNASVSTVQALYAANKSHVSIVFMSIVNFPKVGPETDPSNVMNILAKVAFSLDRVCAKYSTFKVEVIGTTILVMSGLFTEETDKDDDDADENDTYGSHSNDRKSALDALELAKEMICVAQTIPLSSTSGEATDDTTPNTGSGKKQSEMLKLRVGIHLGNVTYGVVGQNVPKLSCFGDDMAVAYRLTETANENCIRVSKAFHDFVGTNEKGWDDDTEIVHVSHKNPLDDSANTVTTALMSTASSTLDLGCSCSSNSDVSKPGAPFETYTLEPPPPDVSDAFSQSYDASVSSSFPSLSPWGSSEFFDGGNMLGANPMEESFVSGEFYVD